MLGVAKPRSIILFASDCFKLTPLLLDELAFDGVVVGVEIEVEVDAEIVLELVDDEVFDGMDDDGVMEDGFVLVTVNLSPPPELPCFIAN